MTVRACRFCDAPLERSFVDLGMSPLANSYVKEEQVHAMEPFFPLHVYVCEKCLLVQLPEWSSPDNIFSDYAYFSSFSTSWLEHAKRYVEMIVERLRLNKQSFVVEIASNDGYLLKNFVAKHIPVLGIEPAANVAKVAVENGIPSLVKFFGEQVATGLAKEGKQADLIIGNNVLAHVPKLNDFVRGLKTLLKPAGVITMEFPHLMQLMGQNQFDTIYHEHFSYFSFLAVERIFSAHGLTLFDVDEVPTHGGSLRIYGRHPEDISKPVSQRVKELRGREEKAGFGNLEHYLSFGEKVVEIKNQLLEFLIKAKREGKSVVGYGAPAKGNTLLNYCGVKSDYLAYTVDRSPYKQHHYLPGVRIPIFDPERLRTTKPEYLLILPWNLKDEIMGQMAFIREWGGQFVVPIPKVQVLR
ncbi:MAG: class I SAM-dependent methyltransferase [Nitrospira defluvii]|nr:class I SAM-dependent methyltransferase [Nitrospira defluvii]